MNHSELWIIILGGMAVTFLIRLSFILLIPPDRLPEWFRSGLRFVPPAVLAALIAPDLLLLDGTLHLTFANHRLVAGLIAMLVAWRTRNTWFTIGSGLLTFGLLGLL